MWEQSKTVFVTLNIPGGSNNDIDPWFSQATPNPAQPLEMAARTAADVRWLDAAFAKAEADNAHSVVIVGQSDMWDTTDAPAHQTNYEPIIAAMASNAQTYGKPVLYLNGDSHVYRSDDPLQQGSTCYTESGACTRRCLEPAPVLRRAELPPHRRARLDVPARVAEADDRPARGVGERIHADLVGPVQLAAADPGLTRLRWPSASMPAATHCAAIGGIVHSAWWCVWLVGGDRASGFVGEGGMSRVAAGPDVVVVQQLVVAGAEQDEVVELGGAAVLDGDEVVCLELARGGAAGVLAVR